mgnify:CR=1 FL=1
MAALTRPDFLPALTPEDREHILHLEATFERLSDEIVRLRDAVAARQKTKAAADSLFKF